VTKVAHHSSVQDKREYTQEEQEFYELALRYKIEVSQGVNSLTHCLRYSAST